MNDSILTFERIARVAKHVGVRPEQDDDPKAHPFDERNVHSDIAGVARKLFDDGHYSQATFEAFKCLDNEVKRISGVNDSGFNLMMKVFDHKTPKIKLNELSSQSEIDEQLGYRHVFAGVMSAIRNPRGHDNMIDPIDRCLDHLSFASVLLKRLEERKLP